MEPFIAGQTLALDHDLHAEFHRFWVVDGQVHHHGFTHLRGQFNLLDRVRPVNIQVHHVPNIEILILGVLERDLPLIIATQVGRELQPVIFLFQRRDGDLFLPFKVGQIGLDFERDFAVVLVLQFDQLGDLFFGLAVNDQVFRGHGFFREPLQRVLVAVHADRVVDLQPAVARAEVHGGIGQHVIASGIALHKQVLGSKPLME